MSIMTAPKRSKVKKYYFRKSLIFQYATGRVHVKKLNGSSVSKVLNVFGLFFTNSSQKSLMRVHMGLIRRHFVFFQVGTKLE